ncbi:MAG: ribosome biogenesis GTPase Der [Gemmatimonadota bacterium]
MSERLPVVAVVGRPNVGKSTFFNRVLGARIAIVDDQPGVTRDRNFARADWAGRRFQIVDTGGIVEGSDEPMDRQIREQAHTAIAEADVIVFMVDAKVGLHPLDERLADVLRAAGRPVLVVANKVDDLPHGTAHHEFWALGLGEPVPVSSNSGKGSGDVLDRIVELLPEPVGDEEQEKAVRIAIIGKPNVGKSSLINRLFGQERSVVSDVPGTTRDPIDSSLTYHAHTLTFVDTAGLRRHARIKDSVEFYSALRTDRVVQEADVCVLVVDGNEGLGVQDLKIADAAWSAGCGLIILVNKWDLVEKDTNTAIQFEKEFKKRAPSLETVPVLFVSALTGLRVHKLLDLVVEVWQERRRRVPTAEVNEVLEQAVRKQPPPHHRGRPVKLKYMTQTGTEPPTFVVFANYPDAVPEHYIRYMHHALRNRWPFAGVPLRVRVRASSGE